MYDWMLFCVLGGTSVLSHFFLLGSTSSILRTFLGQEVVGGTSVLGHFFLLGGTSSILRTFLGGTIQKKHPVDSISGSDMTSALGLVNTFRMFKRKRI